MPISRKGKEEAVAAIKAKLLKSPVVAVASLQNLPSRQFNKIKKALRGQADLVVARNSLLARAISEAKPEVAELVKHFDGSSALIFASQNPFMLYATIKSNMSKTAAKPGQTAPYDLVVPAGETNLPPGPVLTELKAAGISAKIAGPKIFIDKDSTVAKKGDVITDAKAKILAKLGVEPMDVGLNVLVAWENGTAYPKGILDIDADAFRGRVVAAHQSAVNLAVFAEIYNGTTTPLIIAKAARSANAVKSIVDKAAAPAEAAVSA